MRGESFYGVEMERIERHLGEVVAIQSMPCDLGFYMLDVGRITHVSATGINRVAFDVGFDKKLWFSSSHLGACLGRRMVRVVDFRGRPIVEGNKEIICAWYEAFKRFEGVISDGSKSAIASGYGEGLERDKMLMWVYGLEGKDKPMLGRK